MNNLIKKWYRSDYWFRSILKDWREFTNYFKFNMKKLLVLVVIVLTFSSCARFWGSVDRKFQVGDREYWVEVYSGGKMIKQYHFKGMLNNQENSDGYYFTSGDSLIEIGGDVIVKSID